MSAALAVAAILTAALGLLLVAAGASLLVRTTRSPVAAFILARTLGVKPGEAHEQLSRLFEAHAAAFPNRRPMTIERYRRGLALAGGLVLLLGAALLGFLGWALTLLAGATGRI